MRNRREVLATLYKFGLFNQKIQSSLCNIDADEIAILDECDRSPINCFRCNVTYAETCTPTGETTVGEEQS